MENKITTFSNEEFGNVRTMMIDGDPWFVAADVCKILGLNQVTNAVKSLDEDERGCRKYKSFDPTFSKVGGFLGQRPESSSAELETPKTSEKVPLFGTFSPR